MAQKIENLECCDIYHKIQYMFKVYLQIFVGVACCFLVSRGRSDFVLNLVNHIRIYGRNCFCYQCPYFSQTCRKRWIELCF